jgi:hypothetical protein
MPRNFRLKSPAARARFIPVACWMLAGMVIPLGSLPARAAVAVHGTSAAVHVVAHNAKVSEVLRAMTETLESFRCKETTNLDDVISGSYNGPVEDVLGRILRGYDYVITILPLSRLRFRQGGRPPLRAAVDCLTSCLVSWTAGMRGPDPNETCATDTPGARTSGSWRGARRRPSRLLQAGKARRERGRKRYQQRGATDQFRCQA